MAILAGIDRGYVSREEGLRRMEKIVGFLEKADRFKGCLLYTSWKHNTGYTPEIGGSAIAFGVDNGTYPVPAVYTFGINLTF